MEEIDRGYAKVKSGWLEGEKLENGVKVFRGIPYAAAPVGELRWKAPEPAAQWRGVRKATGFGCEAVQEGILNRLGSELEPGLQLQLGDQLKVKPDFLTGAGLGSSVLPVSEDCLYLNIWTPARSASERLAVMVWIHGGSLQEGAGSNFLYDSRALAETGIVVVTINYRLGIFGFLAHPGLTRENSSGSSGNYGLLDQLMAIKWVRENIAGFGGDPERITVGGQSAGGLSVGALLASPLSTGLFHRAIIQSGPPFGFSEFHSLLEEEEKVGENFVQVMGAADISELRAASTRDIFEKSREICFMPRITVDGWFLNDYPGKAICSGSCQKVSVLLGGTSHEFSDKYSPEKGLDRGEYIQAVKNKYGSFADRILELYPPAADDVQTARTAVRLESHMLLSGARKTAEAIVQNGNEAYLYYFSRAVAKDNDGFYGANHSAELPFLFGLENRGGVFPWNVRKWEISDCQFSGMLMKYWSSFIKNGNPNAKGLMPWPEYEHNNCRLLELGEETEEMQNPEVFNSNVFNGLFEK